MKFRSITIAGNIAFPQETTIDFPDAETVALVGPNGSGKTSVLDSIHSAMFGRVPNRKPAAGMKDDGVIYTSFPNKGGKIDFTFAMNGRVIRIVRLIDGVAKKQTPYLYVDGVAVTEGKKAEFDAEFFRYTGLTEQLYLASVYAAQSGRGGITALDEKERRGLLDDVLSLFEFEEPLELVAKAHADLSRLIDDLRTQIKAIDVLQASADELSLELSTTESEERTLSTELARKTRDLEAAQQALADAKANEQGTRELVETLRELETEVESKRSQIKDLAERIANNRTLLLNRENEIRHAASEYQRLAIEIRDAEQTNHSNERALEQAEQKAKRERDAILAEIPTAEGRLREKTRAREALSVDREKHVRELSSIEVRLSEAQRRSALLQQVPCGGTPMSNECTLLADARSAAQSVDKLTADVAGAKAAIATIDSQIDLAAEKELRERIDALNKMARQVGVEEVEAARRAVQRGRTTIAELLAEQNAHQKDASLLPNLELAREKIQTYETQKEELEASILQLEDRIGDLQRRIDTAGKSEETQRLAERYDALKQIIAMDTERQKSLIARIGELRSAVANAQAVEERIAGLDARLKGLLEKERIYGILREGLGPKGARALLIDAAGPAISAAINAILTDTYGTRFQVEIKTQRAAGNGTLREAMEILVYDNEKEVIADVENKSGGEQAMLKEAISLGLALYKRQHSAADLRTLIRDETTAALDATNAHTYLEMLRSVMKRGNFDQVIYVTHKPEIAAQADATIRVGAGQALVEAA